MTRLVLLPAMTQISVPSRTNARGVVYLKLKSSPQIRHGLRMASGLRDVASGHLHHLLIANFTKKRALF